MAVEKDKIKDLFSSKLNGFEPEVPASVWGGIDQLLSDPLLKTDNPTDTSSSSSSTSGSSAGGSGLTKIGGAILGVAATAVAVVTLIILSQDQDMDTETQLTFVENVQIDSINSIVDIEPSASEPLLTDFSAPVRKPHNLATVEGMSEEDRLKMMSINNLTLSRSFLDAKPSKKNFLISIASWPIFKFLDYPEEGKEKGLSVSFNSNFSVLRGDVRYVNNGSLLFANDLRTKEFIYALDKENSDYDLHHQMPLSLGLLISKEITSRFSVETGLYYIHTSSEISSKSAYQLKEEQSLNYFAIPLNFNYILLSSDKLDFYISVGAMIQKDIEGTYSSSLNRNLLTGGKWLEGVVDDIAFKEPYYLKTNISQSNPQFSIRSNLGISYPLYRSLRIYGNIGGAYYFDAGNKYRTIYSDRKFQLDLNMGLKVDF